MLHLLWGLLNMGLLLFFIAVCFKAIMLIRDNIGVFAAFVFTLGILSISNNNNSNFNETKDWKFASEDSLERNSNTSISITLERSLVTYNRLTISYGTNKQNQLNTPTAAYSHLLGFTSGFNWKPGSISIDKTKENNKFEYFVHGTLEWKLLGARIYSQPKDYTGIAITK